jgi:hypothetical protein
MQVVQRILPRPAPLVRARPAEREHEQDRHGGDPVQHARGDRVGGRRPHRRGSDRRARSLYNSAHGIIVLMGNRSSPHTGPSPHPSQSFCDRTRVNPSGVNPSSVASGEAVRPCRGGFETRPYGATRATCGRRFVERGLDQALSRSRGRNNWWCIRPAAQWPARMPFQRTPARRQRERWRARAREQSCSAWSFSLRRSRTGLR